MTYDEVLKNAKDAMAGMCVACPVCNGKFCSNHIPGPGAKGVGDGAIRNYDKWKEIRLNMDTICDNSDVDASVELFGKSFKYPIFGGPVSAVKMHYGDKYTDEEFNSFFVHGCAESGVAAFVGDGLNGAILEGGCKAIKEAKGVGVPTIKPWNMETIKEKLELAEQCGAFAVAMDIDAAGLPFLKGMNPPAGSKTVQQLKEIRDAVKVPFILKGIMTVKGALKAKEAGADAIIVSNHGGRVLDQCPASAEVLPEIVDALKGSNVKILVDGGIRSGADVFKALAMGADGVVVCRPFVYSIYGGGKEGAMLLVDKLGAELEDAMTMCGVKKLSDISREHIRM